MEKPPIFPMVSFGLAGLEPKIPKIHWEEPLPDQKIWRPCPWELTGVKIEGFSSQHAVVQNSLGGALGKIWAVNPPPFFPVVTFSLGGLGGRLLPMDFDPENSQGQGRQIFWSGRGSSQ